MEPEVPEPIYQTPGDYDLEHVGDTDDVEFFVRLAVRLQPRRVLELACGSGRVTLPLAEAGARHDFEVVGLELVPEMLEAARQRRTEATPEVRDALTLLSGDMREWRSEAPFDLILVPCSSVCHLLTLDEQIGTWARARENLAPGGRLAVDVVMPDLGAYADSFRTPPRELVEVDLDTEDPESGVRMIRYKTTRYEADQQRARIRFLYDKFREGAVFERSVSDFESHVYYPRELELLFRHTGFTVEHVYGDYRGRKLRATSKQILMVGRRPET